MIQAYSAAVGCSQGSECQSKSFSFHHPIASGSRFSRRGITLDAFPKRSNIIQFLPSWGLKERQHLKKQYWTPRTAQFSLRESSPSTARNNLSWEHCVCLSSAQCEAAVRFSAPAPLSLSGSCAHKHECAGTETCCGHTRRTQRHSQGELQSRGASLLLSWKSVLVVKSLPSGHVLTFQWGLLIGWWEQLLTRAVIAHFWVIQDLSDAWEGCWEKQHDEMSKWRFVQLV